MSMPANPDPIKLIDAIEQLVEGKLLAGAPAAPLEGAASTAIASPHVETSWRPTVPPPRTISDMRDVICAASFGIRQYAAEHGCQLRLKLPADPLLVEARPDHLEIALLNLLRNAIDANATVVTLRGGVDADRVDVQIDDDGTAIAAESAAVRASRGQWCFDIGGAIARSIVEDHGGQLHRISRPGLGSTARLQLPREMQGAVS